MRRNLRSRTKDRILPVNYSKSYPYRCGNFFLPHGKMYCPVRWFSYARVPVILKSVGSPGRCRLHSSSLEHCSPFHPKLHGVVHRVVLFYYRDFFTKIGGWPELGSTSTANDYEVVGFHCGYCIGTGGGFEVIIVTGRELCCVYGEFLLLKLGNMLSIIRVITMRGHA